MPVGRGGRNTEHGRRLFASQSRKIPQLDESRFGGILNCEFVERFIERQHVFISLWRCNGFKWLTLESATAFMRLLPPRRVDNDSPHGRRRRGKVVASILIYPGLVVLGLATNKTKICFMHERRGLQSMPRLLFG